VKRQPIRIAAVVVAVLVSGFAVLAATRPNFEASAEVSPLIGTVAPAFSTTSLEGAPVELRTHRGRYVVLNFFASWCGPCREEAPNLVEFAYGAKRDGVPVDLLSIVFNDSDTEALSFVHLVGQRWPALRDRGGQIAADYGVTSPPTTVLISPLGRVVSVLVGPTNAQQLRLLIANDEHR
jgi:thiol-disulfide isomerase/thioredoxin